MNIAKRIVEEAKKKASSLITSAKREVREELKEKEEELKERNAREIEIFKEELKEKEEEEMASSRIEKKRIIEQAYEEKFRQFLDEIVKELESFKKSKEYGEFLKRSIERAVREIKRKDLILRVPKGDKSLLRGIKLPSQIKEVREDLEELGGVVVESKDGKVRINYSFSTLIDKKREELKRELVKELKKDVEGRKKKKAKGKKTKTRKKQE